MSRDVPLPVTDHLEELRSRIIRSLTAFAVAFFVSWFYVDEVIAYLARPVGSFVFVGPAEAFLVRLKIAAGVAVFAAFPYFLFEIWRFVEVALELRERSLMISVLPASCLLFFLGGALAFFGVVPIAARFLLDFGGEYLRPMISLGAYMSFLTWMVIGFGIFFQLPLVVVALCRLGVVDPLVLSAHRKHVLVGVVIVASILTPGPDVISMALLAVPSYVLFELSLIVARRVAPASAG